MDTECVCGLKADGKSEARLKVAVDELKAEVPMDKQRIYDLDVVFGWLREKSFLLVLGMSIFHVGLAYVHTRESGRRD